MTIGLPRLGRVTCGLAAVSCFLTPVHAQDARDEEQFRVAMGLVQRGLHDDAATELEAFLRAQPGHRLAREAWYRLAVCMVELGRTDDAIAAFSEALERRGPFSFGAECRYRLGNTLKEKREFEPAQAAYRELIDAVEEDHYLLVPSLYAEGECLRELGQLETALASFGQAAQRAGEDDGRYGMPALYQAGFVLLRLDRFADARTAFRTAAQRYPDHEAAAECSYLEGDAAFRGGDLDAAEGAYSRAHEAGGEFADDALMGLAWCALEREREGQAFDRFTAVYSEHADSPHADKARLEAGRIRYRRGELAEAVAELEPLTAEDVVADIRLAALELQGLSLLDGGSPEPALGKLNLAMQLATDDDTRARVLYAAGESLAELERWEQALGAYGEAANRAGETPLLGDIRYGQSLALHKLSQFEASLGMARTVLEKMPDHRLATHARFSAAENLFALQRYADADQEYAAVPAEHELGANSVFKRAWCAFLAGDLETGAKRFGDLAKGEGPYAEESLSMAALANLNSGAMDAALAAADRYRARYPEGAHLARTERVAARVLRDRGDLSGATQRLARAAKAEGSEDQVARDVLEQAELQFQRGDFEAAEKLYAAQANRMDEVGAKALEGLAWCAFEIGDDDACLDRVSRAVAHPQVGASVPALIELRLAALHRSEQWAEAVVAARQFRESFDDHPRVAEVAFGQAIAHSRAGELSEARAIFGDLAATEAFPRTDELHYEWGWASRRDGDERAALSAFGVVAETSQDEERAGEARLHLGLAALEERDLDAARGHLLAVQGSYRPQALYRAAFAWFEDGEAERALEPLAEMLTVGPDHPLFFEGVFLAGECELQLERFDDAATRYQKLLQQAPDHERGQLSRLHGGRCLVLTSRAADAAATLEDYLQRGGGSRSERAEAHLWLGRARAAREEYGRAEESYQKTTTLSEGPLAAEAQFRIGEVRKAKGDLDGAVGAFVKLSILYGHEEWIRRGLLEAGLCYEELQQPIKAAKFFRELVERFPDCGESERARGRLERLGGE